MTKDEIAELLQHGRILNLEIGQMSFEQANRFIDQIEGMVGPIARTQIIGAGCVLSIRLADTPNPIDGSLLQTSSR